MPCVKKYTKKYTFRNSPPYPANECKGHIMRGNDGRSYESQRASNGVYRWIGSSASTRSRSKSRSRSSSKRSRSRSRSRTPKSSPIRRRSKVVEVKSQKSPGRGWKSSGGESNLITGKRTLFWSKRVTVEEKASFTRPVGKGWKRSFKRSGSGAEWWERIVK